MLHATADFPHPGSTGFLAPTGDQVRIVQRRADTRLTIAVTDARYPGERASGTRTVEASEVHPTREQATALPKPRRRARK